MNRATTAGPTTEYFHRDTEVDGEISHIGRSVANAINAQEGKALFAETFELGESYFQALCCDFSPDGGNTGRVDWSSKNNTL